MTLITPVIMCGGAGTRLWPASRQTRPKQFITLIGELSLFQQTVRRVSQPSVFAKPICITNDEYRFTVAEQLAELGVDADIVLEPCRRDSGPALCAAGHIAFDRDRDAVLLATPADHYIRDDEAFSATIGNGLGAAQEGLIVTFGIEPTHPNTGYGYIAPSSSQVGVSGVVRVDRFVEKPDAATAEQYLKDGFLWNSGNFLAKAATLVEEFETHAPNVAGRTLEAVKAANTDLDFLRLDADAYAASDRISVDYAVMEKSSHAAVLRATFDWSDIGSWDAVWQNSPRDGAGNSLRGDSKVFGGENNCVYSDSILTAVIGADDLTVVATRDAVLVAPRGHAEDIKQFVAQLQSEGRVEATDHTKVFRPWGNYESIDRGKGYQVKRITVVPGGRLSLQSHRHRAEHWVVVSGSAIVTIGEERKTLNRNESVYVPIGAVHRLENAEAEPLELIEVQSGEYLGEDDIERYDDVYGRDVS